MTSRKTRGPKTVTTTEDAFGTPAAARGGMMTVAGASDSDETTPLLTDDENVLREWIAEILGELAKNHS